MLRGLRELFGAFWTGYITHSGTLGTETPSQRRVNQCNLQRKSASKGVRKAVVNLGSSYPTRIALATLELRLRLSDLLPERPRCCLHETEAVLQAMTWNHPDSGTFRGRCHLC